MVAEEYKVKGIERKGRYGKIVVGKVRDKRQEEKVNLRQKRRRYIHIFYFWIFSEQKKKKNWITKDNCREILQYCCHYNDDDKIDTSYGRLYFIVLCFNTKFE